MGRDFDATTKVARSLRVPKVKVEQRAMARCEEKQKAGRVTDTCAPGHYTRAGGSLLSNTKNKMATQDT